MWNRLNQIANWLLPTAALGLYCGRIVSEQWGVYYQTGLITAICLTIGFLSFSYFILRHHTLRQGWPLLILLGYVFYPEIAPHLALFAGLCSLFTLLLLGHSQSPVFESNTGVFSSRTKLSFGICLTAVFSFLLYFFTLSPDILPADNGEFQWVATQLGLAHPPGFPLYTMLAHLFTQLPVNQSPAFMVNLFSAVTSSATVALVYWIVWLLTKRHLAAVTAVLALATSTTFWAQATIANIRSLTAFFAALAILALVQWYLGVRQWGSGAGDRWLWLFVAAIVLGFTHHLSLLFMGLVFVVVVGLIDWQFFVTPKRWIRPFLVALICLIPLLYLPIIDENLRSIDSFLFHFLGLGFQGDFFYFIQPIVLIERFKVMLNVLTFQFHPLLLLGMLIGLLLLGKYHWKMAFLLGGSFALHSFVTATYRAPQTVEYMLPAYVPMVVCLGFAVGYLDNFQRRSDVVRGLGQLLIAAFLLTAVLQGWQQFPDYRQLHASRDTRDYTQAILENAPEKSVILTNWHWATPLWYLQDVEGIRPDVEVRYIPPGGESYEQTWAAEIEAELANGRNVIATNFDAAAYENLPPAQPFGEAYLFPSTPLTNLPEQFTPINETLNDIQILGYHLTPTTTQPTQEVILTIAWQSPISNLVTTSDQSPIPLFTHLIGFDGRLYAQSDVSTIPQAAGITLTQFHLTPRPGALPGDYAIKLGQGETQIDLTTLAVTPMKRPLATQNETHRPDIENGRTLIGTDWDNTTPKQPRLYLHWQTADGYITETRDGNAGDLPTYLGPWGIPQNSWTTIQRNPQTTYVPLSNGIIWTGTSISNASTSLSTSLQSPISANTNHNLPTTFLSSQPILRDYTVSLRLIGFEEDGFHWAWCDGVDSVPAMGAIPTLKWISGKRITSPHQIVYANEHPGYETFCSSHKPAPNAPVLFVDDSAYNGQTVGGTLILYDAFTKRPLSILDERINANYQWIPLGTTFIQTENNN